MNKNKNKNSKVRMFGFVLTVFTMLVWFGCDNSFRANEELKIVDYELYDGITIQVTLDPDIVHNSLNFNAMEEYDNYGLALEEAGVVIVNTRLWNELSHAYDPIEISMFDMNRSLIVENVKYTAEHVALYRLDLSDENAEPILEVFYGESGEEDLIEIEKVFIARINSDDLSNYRFKNPDAIELYKKFNLGVEQRDSNSETVQYSFFYDGSDCSSSCDSFTFIYPNSTNPYKFRYRLSPTGPVQEAHIGHVLWNQSHRSGIRKRSRGGTITIIDRLNGSGYQALGDNAFPIGPYHENGSFDTSTPETYVRVAGRNSDGTYRDIQYSLSNTWTARRGSVKRGGGGTHSWHRAKVRMNNSNTSVDIFYPERYVP